MMESIKDVGIEFEALRSPEFVSLKANFSHDDNKDFQKQLKILNIWFTPDRFSRLNFKGSITSFSKRQGNVSPLCFSRPPTISDYNGVF
jgi:hypothetical protein